MWPGVLLLNSPTMLPDEFTLLPPDDKLVTTLNSTILAAIAHNEEMWLLYSINDFYVELQFDKKRWRLTDIRIINNTEALTPYVQNIRLNGVL